MNAFSKQPLYSALVSACALIGCSHEGVGSGTLVQRAASSGGDQKSSESVEFFWRSGADPSQGHIDAVTSDGRRFVGTYLQPRGQAWVDAYGPYWNAWTSVSWGVPAPWFAGTPDGFITMYSGKALAHLASPDATRMRCVFLLREPRAGLAGGGEGDCQLSSQERVFAARLSKG